MSSNTIAIVTLVLGIIAAVFAVIAGIPQIPALWKMIVKPNISVEIVPIADNKITVGVKNGIWVSVQNFILTLEFSGADKIIPQPRFTPANANGQGFIVPPIFSAVSEYTLQASVSDTLSTDGELTLGDIQVQWNDSEPKKITSSIWINHKKIRSETFTFN